VGTNPFGNNPLRSRYLFHPFEKSKRLDFGLFEWALRNLDKIKLSWMKQFPKRLVYR